jgi:hypothetical protein
VAYKAEEKGIKKATGFKLFNLKSNRINAEKELKKAQQKQADYHKNLHGITGGVHPFSSNDNSINDAETVSEKLENSKYSANLLLRLI